MATPKARVEVTTSWQQVTAAANVPGVTWQNVGGQNVFIAFTAIEPVRGDVYLVLPPFQAFYDKNGSPRIWAKAESETSVIMATEE